MPDFLRSPHYRQTEGFTLLEVLVVISIMGLLSTMAVPMLGQSLKRWKANQFTRQILTAQSTARFHAISKRRHIQVRYHINDSEEKLTFYICETIKINGDCKSSSWKKFEEMNVLKGDNEYVDIWSVGDKTSGVACMYYKPDGSILKPRDADGASGYECPGDPSKSVGTGVHVTWKPNPDETKESEHCKWKTIVHISDGTGNPTLIKYGAYPNSGGPFDNHTISDEPSCAS